MKRKKRHEHVNHERWLVSYADFMTLLFAFFVVLFAAGQADKKKQAALAGAMQQAFRGGVFDGRGAGAVPGSAGASWGSGSSMLEPGLEEGLERALVRDRLKAAVAGEVAAGVVEIRESADGLTVSLRDAGFFASGSAVLRPQALEVLERIAAALPEAGLRVEGHTDDVPIATEQYGSNWELSSARASSIARLLLRHANVRAERMAVAGYAQFHPIAGNETAAGRARNRRVDVVVLGR